MDRDRNPKRCFQFLCSRSLTFKNPLQWRNRPASSHLRKQLQSQPRHKCTLPHLPLFHQHTHARMHAHVHTHTHALVLFREGDRMKIAGTLSSALSSLSLVQCERKHCPSSVRFSVNRWSSYIISASSEQMMWRGYVRRGSVGGHDESGSDEAKEKTRAGEKGDYGGIVKNPSKRK